jgi:hypothetical protein
MSKFISINGQGELIAETLRDHPDYELFSRLGAVENFASRQYGTGGEVVKGVISHYLSSQQTFNNHSMKCLIDLVRDFDFRSEGFSMEALYQRITEERLNISLNNPDSYKEEVTLKVAYQDFFGLERQEIPKEVTLSRRKVKDRKTNFDYLRYRPSSEMTVSSTKLTGNKKYEKYSGISKTQKHLKLLDVMSVLQEEQRLIDRNTILGGIIVEDGVVTHCMGVYKLREDLNQGPEVDEMTNLAAAKALSTDNETEAMRYAFGFAVLRGYNLRSVIGACFAQEMSLRWIFAQKGWPQFQKAPGVYLDIEAAVLHPEAYANTSLNTTINKQVQDYCTANAAIYDSTISLAPDSFFDIPKQQQKNDFIIYLVETKRYRAQDLSDIISSEIAQEVLKIAAKKGDLDFFKMLAQEFENSDDFKRQFTGEMQRINHEEIIECAMKYGGSEILKLVRDLRPSTEPEPSVAKTTKASPVLVNGIG